MVVTARKHTGPNFFNIVNSEQQDTAENFVQVQGNVF
jgi:hypothetical protein